MSITELFKSIFPHKPKIEDYFINQTVENAGYEGDGTCSNTCGSSFFCSKCGMVNNCHWIQKLENFDKSKESILIIDDNEGVVSFIKDDLEVVFQERGMSLDSYNILEFSSGMAAYHFIATSQFYGGLNITKAIIDISFPGFVQTEKGSVRYNGVDIFREVYRYNKDVKFFFYTGNLLNPYIKSNAELIEEFKEIYHDKINDYVLLKMSKLMDDRRQLIAEKLF